MMVNHLFNLKKLRAGILMVCLLAAGLASGQVSPVVTSSTFASSNCTDGSSRELFSFTDIVNEDGFAAGTGEVQNGLNIIGANFEYLGTDNGINAGTSLRANAQDDNSTDEWAVIFDVALTNPVVFITNIDAGTELTFKDAAGTVIPSSDLGSNFDLVGTAYSRGSGYVQLLGTYDAVNISVALTDADNYQLWFYTCVSEIAPPVLPGCGDCVTGDSEFLSLDRTGRAMNPVTGDEDLDYGLVEIDGICYGTYEFIYSDLDINNDGQGTTFGGFDRDGGTMVLRVDLCEDIFINEIAIRNLESQSIVSIGTTITALDASGVVGGIPGIATCGSSSPLIVPVPGTTNSFYTEAGSSCGPNPNGFLKIGAPVSTLFFKYENPDNSTPNCSYDYVGFRVNVCHTPPVAAAVPVCPLESYKFACVDPAGNLEQLSGSYIVDGAGNVFRGNTCTANIPAADGSGNVRLEDAVEMGIALETANVGCAEITEVLTECDFDSCKPEPTCADCGEDNFEYINLRYIEDNAAGLPSGNIELDGVVTGTYDFVSSNVSVSLDGRGTTFGGFHGNDDEGEFLLHLQFCSEITIVELDVINLEVMSQISVGTAVSAAGVLSGSTLTYCSGSSRMDSDDITNGNTVTTAGPGCGANPNATYTVGPQAVSELYFKYVNPAMGCSYDYVGFRIGACVAAPAVPVVPACPLSLVTVTTDMDVANGTTAASTSNSDTYLVDANGNYFNRRTCYPTDADGLPILPTVPVALAKISPCAEVIAEEDCGGCTPPPPCTDCPADNSYKYISLQNRSSRDAGGTGDIMLNGVPVGDFLIVSSDLDISNDVSGTTFGGWDRDGGTLELQLNFCEPIMAQQLDIRNLEAQSIVTLTGATITQCDGPIQMGVTGGTGNEVESAFTGSCGPNPNGSYQFASGNPITSLTFKYENPVPATGRNCSGDYVGFRIGVCVPDLGESVPMCSLDVLESSVTLADGSVVTELVVKGADGKYYDYTDLPNMGRAADLVALDEVAVSPCATLAAVCGAADEATKDTRKVCKVCFIEPVFGNITCSTDKPVIGSSFTISATGLENMKGVDNNETDFNLNAYLYPAGKTAADYAYPPVTTLTIAEATAMGTQPTVPVFLGALTLTNDCTEGSLNVSIPSDFPQGSYSKVLMLDKAPTLDPESRPSYLMRTLEVIPTMGQWALFILALLMSSLAVVRIRQAKNHEVKKLA